MHSVSDLWFSWAWVQRRSKNVVQRLAGFSCRTNVQQQLLPLLTDKSPVGRDMVLSNDPNLRFRTIFHTELPRSVPLFLGLATVHLISSTNLR